MSPSSPLRAGRLVTETELAEAAAAALDAAGVSQSEAARRIGKNPSAVTMALDPAKYPDRGHAVRRALVREFGGYDLDGPLYRLRKAEG
ncbi:hypothetical protein [Rubrivirga sp.]|uniref:hypothetical protein n=1 Tax=Rubrivirga sp. TaxID=1885344 RepID=UPI003B52740C